MYNSQVVGTMTAQRGGGAEEESSRRDIHKYTVTHPIP